MTKNRILESIKANKKYIQSQYGVEKIGLFGSYAKSLQKENSDIDIYVEFREKRFRNIAGLCVYLEEMFKKRIDLVYKHKRSKGAIFDAIQKEVIYG